MEFYLLRAQSTELASFNARGLISGALGIQPEAVLQGSHGADEYCKYLENSLVENVCQWKTIQTQQKLSFHLRMFMTLYPNPISPSDGYMGSIAIYQDKQDAPGGDANILERLNKVHGQYNVSVNVLVAGMDFDGVTKFKFEAKGLIIKLVTNPDNGNFGVEFGILTKHFPEYWMTNLDAGKRLRVNVTLSVNLNHKAVNELYRHHFLNSKLLETNTALLTGGVCSDFVIIAVNGVQVKCHRAFLAARSDVFRAMFESKMKEDASNSMSMEDMSEEGVRALLAYLYCWDVKAASESCDVAFELYRAAEKYNISELEEAMGNLICAKSDEWLSVDTAIRLLLLARNLKKEDGDDASRLLKKAVQVVKWHVQNSQDKLRESVEYQQLYKNSPETALEVGLLLFKMD